VKILFDHGTPAPLRHHLPEHSVDRSAGRGWELLENGELIQRAEEDVVAVERSDAKITVRRVQLSACPVHAEWLRDGNESQGP